MNDRLYIIKETFNEDPYLYEVVESGGQLGVRCRIYITGVELFKGYFDDMTSTQVYNVQKFIENRYKIQSQKFESIVWCWPNDKFDLNIGKEKAKERVIEKINLKKRKIKKFIHKIIKHNLSKRFNQKNS